MARPAYRPSTRYRIDQCVQTDSLARARSLSLSLFLRPSPSLPLSASVAHPVLCRYELFGYEINVYNGSQYRLNSMYAETPDDSLLFQTTDSGMQVRQPGHHFDHSPTRFLALPHPTRAAWHALRGGHNHPILFVFGAYNLMLWPIHVFRCCRRTFSARWSSTPKPSSDGATRSRRS